MENQNISKYIFSGFSAFRCSYHRACTLQSGLCGFHALEKEFTLLWNHVLDSIIKLFTEKSAENGRKSRYFKILFFTGFLAFRCFHSLACTLKSCLWVYTLRRLFWYLRRNHGVAWSTSQAAGKKLEAKLSWMQYSRTNLTYIASTHNNIIG